MYIGKLAQLCGVSTKTIRHYEQIGLLPPAARHGSYRVYRQQDLALVRLIKQSQQLGFSLRDIRQALSHSNQGIPWQVVNQLISDKLQHIADDIAVLEQKRLLLQQHQAAILACLADNPACPPPLT
ncbi:hypothetical protein WG68_12180 [Arsukibacterium ikkense]|uniref:HTH merR-type domain-containing protein n=1 Tax=Arsukibacterium ikkense TaxID=336831 RepID=A0A0M2V3H0_9GAMM|nr:MerR family transcriptional regulator [Arsukibacterium ikkense]KKO45176.1 hypothetical protein WG68_12180 [Arsukibacterium ikkense]